MSMRWPSLQLQMLIGFLIGLGAGLVVNATAAPDAAWVAALTTYVTQPLSQVFLRLLFMLVIPLLFAALVMGVSEMGDLGSLGRTGWRTLAFTLALSAVAVCIGLAAVNLLRPGEGVDPALAGRLLTGAAGSATAILERAPSSLEGSAAIVSIIPSNVVAAAAENEILSVMFFALAFGIGLVLVQDRSPAAATLRASIQGLFEVVMTLINLVIRLAPIAIACLMFNMAALFGWELLERLGAYVAVVVLALGLQMFGVYPLVVWAFGRMSPLAFFRGSHEAILVAFSTASSNATLPTALRVAETRLRLPRHISRFVLTIGATANQNGTALFEGVTVLFLAQFFGVELTLGQQVTVMAVCILGGVGTAGVPAGSLPVVAMILGMVGVPPEGIGLILGVDRLLDMCRTALNVTGDLVVAVAVSRGEPCAEADPTGTSLPDPPKPSM
ncbi:MAG: dicarboxylate/amino acid:cation symporter [Phenylobacterium sp.]|uniref:dicarboxylate/amino acid:cation symporter n=1 Tax=Phenylobacterium sp. TaxID=1871053 RepID=UPI002736ED5B|nr:dicarboxylate/amino acid:cation symporter [Phenylobacterium sp.]MDP3747686.1 dicarboxylate/amino acid:cation symporter [Phenylobacterium sp.]